MTAALYGLLVLLAAGCFSSALFGALFTATGRAVFALLLIAMVAGALSAALVR